MLYITTPIYYVNAAPHIGHAYTTVAADVLARHARQRGQKTFLLTGVDEHGEPVARAAAEQGVSPQQLADSNALRFRQLVDALAVDSDYFVRTSDPRHGQVVQRALCQLRDRGLVYEGLYEGSYCERCADFKSGPEAASGRCATHERPLAFQSERNWFFALSRFRGRIAEHLQQHPDWVFPVSRRAEVLALLGGLEDVSISRASTDWGVAVPWDSSQVVYVWFDALLNYLSGPQLAGVPLESVWPASVQLLGKDIVKFHAVLWPALLLALDLPLPGRLAVHGHLLNRGRKISKSLGNSIDPFDITGRWGSDTLRFALLSDTRFGADGSLDDLESFARAYSQLADGYGNLVRRVFTPAQRLGPLPAVEPYPAVRAAVGDVGDQVQDHLDALELTSAAHAAWDGVRALNAAVDRLAPWTLKHDADCHARTLASLVEGVRAVSVCLHPFVPQATATVLAQFDGTVSWAGRTPVAASGRTVTDVGVLFPK
jgi:methionyl-tRNA synthetase